MKVKESPKPLRPPPPKLCAISELVQRHELHTFVPGGACSHLSVQVFQYLDSKREQLKLTFRYYLSRSM